MEREGVHCLWLWMDLGGGHTVDVELLRPWWWVAAHGAIVGGQILLDLPEQGLCGAAKVLRLEECPLLPLGPGLLVTGWFRHSFGIIYELRIDGETEPLRVTHGHHFWSPDRKAWVQAGELQPGERLLAWDGSMPIVESLTLRADPEPVFNIEVEGDHCYRVGQQGLLVHNASVAGCKKCKEWGIPVGDQTRGKDFSNSFVTLQVPSEDPPSNVDERWGSPSIVVRKRDLYGRRYSFPRVEWMSFRFEGENASEREFVVGFTKKGGSLTENANVWARLIAGTKNDLPGHVMTEVFGGPSDLPKNVTGKVIVTDLNAKTTSEEALAGNAPFMNFTAYTPSDNQKYRWQIETKIKNKRNDNPIVCAKISFTYPSKNTARPNSWSAIVVYRDKNGVWHEESY